MPTVSRDLVHAVLACAVLAGAVGASSGRRLVAELRLSEVHYHPQETPAGGAALPEFIEIANTGGVAIDLFGASFTDGVRCSFAASTVVPPGGFLLVTSDPEALRAAPGVPAAAAIVGFAGRLDDDGERLALVDGGGALIDALDYNDGFPFERAADGEGASLQRLCFDVAAEAPFNWRALPPTPGARAAETLCPPASAAVDPEALPVIFNEIDYHPPGGFDPELEAIELANRSSRAVDLSGWMLDEGVRFTFPPGARVEPGGFLVVAYDPNALATRWGLDRGGIFGPFESGTLANSGEALRLVDAAGRVMDRVRYGQDGAWPAFADGLGGSLQRVDLRGPSDAPGNWRVVVVETEPAAGEWRSFRVEGFWEGPRIYFYVLEAGELLLDGVRLEIKGGDGANLLANGEFDAGLEPWSGTGNHALSAALASGGFGDDGACGRVRATGPGNGFQNALRQNLTATPAAGTPVVLSFHVKSISGEAKFIARSSIATGENGLLWFEADARSGQADPERSLLAPNPVAADETPASIRGVELTPRWPTSQDAVRVEARVEGVDVVSVDARYRVRTGPEVEIALADDGAGVDALAGDGIWSGAIPPAPNESLVWVAVRARTRSGAATWWPRRRNPAEVTGYYVVDRRPESNDDLRLMYIFTPGALQDLTCADGVWRGGDFVDHRGRAYRGVGVKFRGETACAYPKRPMRVKFLKGDRFDGQGRLNFNAGWNDKSMLREQFGFDFFRDAGVGHSETQLARVHTNGGVFHGAYFTVEDPNEDWLDRNGLDTAGGFYKARSAMLNAATSGYESRTDGSPARLAEIGDFASRLNSLSGQPLVDFLESRLDVDEVIDYQAVQLIIIDGDSVVKNWLLYLGRHGLEPAGPDTVKMFPWDIDLSHGQMLLTTDVRNYDIHPLFQTQTYPFHDQGYHGILNALLQRAPGDRFVKAFYGRIWALLQEKYRPDLVFEKLDRYEAATDAVARLDLLRWPRNWGARGTDPDYWRDDFRTFIRRRYDFLTAYLTAENVTTQGRRFRYSPAPRVRITEIHYHPPGSEDLEFIEISNLEESAVAIGGWTLDPVGWRFPAGATLAARESALVALDPERLRLARDVDGVQIFGAVPRNLPNGGGMLRLRDDGAGGAFFPETIDVVVWEDGGAWPSAADGDGPGLELVDASLDNDLASSWRAGASPGRLAAANGPPVSLPRATPVRGPAPLTVFLDARSALDPDGDPLAIEWRLPGARRDDRDVLLERFESPGVHRVELVVRDAFGAEAVGAIDITVQEAVGPRFRRGDANADGAGDLADAVFVLNYLFIGGDAPGCLDSADVNDSGGVDLSDPSYQLNFLFLGGPAIPEPAAACGADATADELSCASPASCGGD